MTDMGNTICPTHLVGPAFAAFHVSHNFFKIIFFTMLWYIDLIFGMWVYNDKLQIKFTFRSGPMICGRVMALMYKMHKSQGPFLTKCDKSM
jgi:hypothetical protein